ncbi:hypothetical protein Q8F55_009304 [Vanrija albida]|uniref:Major facilitator superfamily (MFS) profile domain-containing protein n=1 Tax=Vanrija albida TaxID=181172 RepID=A0ABR3PTF8_9TREE
MSSPTLSSDEKKDASVPVTAGPDCTLPKRPWQRDVTPWSRIIAHAYPGAGTDADPYVVSWLPDADGFKDRENPLVFKYWYKWCVTIMGATGTLAVSMGSSMLSAAITSLHIEFPGHNNMIYIMVTGIYVLGFVVGPLLWAPMSEVFGRRIMFILTYIPFTAFNAGACGAKDINTLLVMRFFAGTFGSSTMTNSGGIIADMFEAHQRGLAMGVFAAMPFLGPAIGPVAGGFLSEKTSWVWVAAVIAIFSAVLTAVESVLLPETYAPVLLRKRAALLSKATGKVYRCPQDKAKPLQVKQLFLNQLKVPYILLFTEPIVLITALYMAVIYALLFMQFTAFPLVFQGMRHWSPGIAGLAFVGVSVGAFICLAAIIFYINPKYACDMRAKGYLPPEARLPSTIIGAVLLPIGLFIFAWTCTPVRIHWIAPIIATVPFGGGIVLLFLGISNYLVDAYLMNAASVLAAGTVTRSILGVVFPLFTVDMYNAMGPHWAGTFTALLATLFIPVPIILLMKGQKIRRLTKPGRDADDLGQMMAKMMMAQRAAAAGGGAGVAGGAAAAAAPAAEAKDDGGIDEEAVLQDLETLSRQVSPEYAAELERVVSQHSRSPR